MKEENINNDTYDYENNLQLIELARAGDKKALNRLVEINMPLVASISKKFFNRGYEYEDIFQLGCIGLVKAINNFEPKFNVKFSTYAVPMIMGEIKRFLRDDGIIKVSRSVKATAKKIHYDKEKLIKQLNREPSIEELAAFSGVSAEDIVFATDSANSMQYLYDIIHQDDGAPVLLIDKLCEKETEDKGIVDRLLLKEILRELEPKAKQIILLRYFKDKTQIQVSKMLGISQVQVSRIEKRVLKALKEKLI